MYWILKLAWKNMWRNRNRTLITMASVFFAVMLSVLASSLKEGVFNNLVKNLVSFYTGYIQIHKKGYWKEQTLEHLLNKDFTAEQKLKNEKNVNFYTPRFESFALASSGEITKGCLVVGISPESEDGITGLRNKIIKGSYLTEDDNAVLLSQGLADRLKTKLNDTLILIGQGYQGATAAGKYPIKGILKLGAPDLNDKSLFLPLKATQTLFSAENMITAYVLSVHNTGQLSATTSNLSRQLGNNYEVMTWEEMMPEIKQHIETDTNNMKYITGILYMLISFGIFGTFLMMMIERKYEMGLLIAIGMKKSLLISTIIIESVLCVFIGCIAGLISSIPLIFYLNRFPLKMGGETAKAYEKFGFEAIFPTSTDPSIFFHQGFTIMAIGLILTCYPVYKIIQLNPVTAMKR